MKKSPIIAAALLSLFAVSFITPAGIDGKWTGLVTGPEDFKENLTCNFKNTNGTLSGSAQVRDNNPYDISDGKVKGDSLFYAIVVDNGDKIINTGRYYPAGDSISLTMVFMGATMHGTLKRADK